MEAEKTFGDKFKDRARQSRSFKDANPQASPKVWAEYLTEALENGLAVAWEADAKVKELNARIQQLEALLARVEPHLTAEAAMGPNAILPEIKRALREAK